jgi:hypothetical protein
VSLLGDAGRFIDKQAKRVTRTIKKVPVYGHALKAGEALVRGPVGDTIHKISKNPVVSVIAAPYAIPTNLGIAAAKGGVRGATKAAKEELRNPVRRVVLKAVGYVFPPAAAADKMLEASNKVLDAVESEDPVEAAKAAAVIGSAEALADDGDEHSKLIVSQLNAAKRVREKLAGAKLPTRLTDLYHSDLPAREMFGAKLSQIRPTRVAKAVGALGKISQMKPGTLRAMKPDERKHVEQVGRKAANLVAATLAGVGHFDSEYLAELSAAVHRDLTSIEHDDGPMSKEVLGLVEKLMATKSSAQTRTLNRLVLGFNSKDPNERNAAKKQIDKLKRGHAQGNALATSNLNALRRRTAALKVSRGFRVDGTGMSRIK